MKVQKVMRATGEVIETREIEGNAKDFAGKPFICVYGSRRPRKTEDMDILEKDIAEGLRAYVRFEVNNDLMGRLESGASGSFVANKKNVAYLEMSEDEVWKEALKNTIESGLVYKSMSKYMSDITGMDIPEGPMDNLYVVNVDAHGGQYGAGILGIPCVMESLRKIIGDFYILPSSIHEIICVPRSMGCDLDYLKFMVKEVNETVLEPEDKLSDDVFLFDSEGLHRA